MQDERENEKSPRTAWAIELIEHGDRLLEHIAAREKLLIERIDGQMLDECVIKVYVAQLRELADQREKIEKVQIQLRQKIIGYFEGVSEALSGFTGEVLHA